MSTVVEQLLRTIERWGDRVALEDGDRSLTYAALHRRAASIAQGLRTEGIGRGDVVAISIERSLDYVVALIAIWYAGAAFVTLDPSLPEERRAFILDEGAARVLVRGDLDRLETHVAVDPSLPNAEDLAYVVYTSGTTGRPKGVMVAHRGLPSLLDAQIRAFALDETSRSLSFLSTSFDASISDLGTTLVAGATLCFPPAASLVAMLEHLAITHVDVPPSLLARLDPAAMPSSLRTVIIGGEACAPEIVRTWASRLRVVNVYGPTEATICASLVVCDPTTWTKPLLGRPLPGVRFEVVDDELLIGGIGLAIGYRHMPERTAERFVERDGVRWFRTGDRVRRHDDGEIEFLGRLDRQIKIRGVRIEVEEIEVRLAAHPGVREAAVVPRVGATRTTLVAFVAGDANERALRTWLARSLPSAMIPARFELVDALPRTLTGKVDLAALAQRPLGAHEPCDDSLAILEALVVGDPMSIERLLDECAPPVEPIDRPGRAARSAPRDILITGATGFLGARLLGEILARTDARVRCLVRDPERAAHLRAPRVELVIGDLAQPSLGLDRETFDSLGESLDTIFHCGAEVNMAHAYATLRATNVLGTREIARLAATGKPKHLHHVSTLSVFTSADRSDPSRTFREGDDLRSTRAVFGGYAQSKWVAERIVASSGLPITIARVGLVVGSTDDLLSRFVRGLARVRCFPPGIEALAFDVTPLEYAAAAIAQVALFGRSTTYHVANGRGLPLAALIDRMRARGLDLTEVPLATFCERAERDASIDASIARLAFGRGRAIDLFHPIDVSFSSASTEADLRGSGIVCPPPAISLLGALS